MEGQSLHLKCAIEGQNLHLKCTMEGPSLDIKCTVEEMSLHLKCTMEGPWLLKNIVWEQFAKPKHNPNYTCAYRIFFSGAVIQSKAVFVFCSIIVRKDKEVIPVRQFYAPAYAYTMSVQ